MKTTTKFHCLASVCLASVLCFLIPSSTRAANIYWTDGGTGAWNTSSNWVGGAIPGTADFAIFNDGLAHIAQGAAGSVSRLMVGDSATSSGTVVIDGNLNLGAISYIGGNGEGHVYIGQSGSLILGASYRVGGYAVADAPNANHVVGTGYGYTLVEGFLGHATGARTIGVGYDGVGVIDVAATGRVRSGDFYIGDQALSSGTVNVWGVWEAADDIIRIGSSSTMAFGSNVINIHDGGLFLASGSGTVAPLVYIGNGANTTGIVNIAQGGSFVVTSGSVFSIAQGANSRAEFNVDGLFTFTGYSYIGNAGHGTLNVGQTGTARTTSYVHIGRNASTGSGTANIRGLFEVGTSYQIGYGGRGVLNIFQTGTNLVGTYAAIGSTNNSYGEVNVEGLLSVSTHLYLGRNPTVNVTSSGTGVLNILPTGTVTVGGNFIAAAIENSGQTTGEGITSTGTANIAGVLNVTGYISLGQRGVGYFDITNTGTVKTASYLRIADNADTGVGGVRVGGYLEVATSMGVGYAGVGTLEILSGGTVVQTGQNNYVASAVSGAASTGDIIIRSGGYLNTGARAHASQANFGIGWNGQGSLLIETGGTAVAAATTTDNVAFSLGYSGYGSGTIAGTLIAATGYSDIGYSGTGLLTIEDGGLFRADRVRFGASAATSKGTLVLNGGVLEARQLALGAGNATILFNGGTLRASANTDNFFVNFPVLDIDAGSLTLDTQAFAITSTAALAGDSSAVLNKTGIGALTLTADSSAYAGTINVRAGILASGNNNAKLGGIVNILGGAVLDLRNAALATTSDLNFAEGATWAYSLDTQNELTANNLNIAGAGTLYLELGTLNLGTLPIPAAYTLGNYTGAATGLANLNNWTITGGTIAYGAVIDTISMAGSIRLNVNAANVDFLYWQGGNGNWDVTSASWELSGAPVTWAYGALGIFADTPGTVTVSGLQSFSALQFDVDGYILDGSGTLAGSALSGGGSVNFNVTAPTATATINAAIVGAGLYKSGPGALILGGPVFLNGMGATVTVDGGGLAITTATITTNANNAINLTGGGTLSIGGLLDNRLPLYFGDVGAGTLEILSGGSVRVTGGGSSRLGNAAGGNGTLIIRDGGLWQSAAGISVGYNGAGEIYVAQGGSLILDTACLYIADQNGSSGSVTIDGYYQSGSNGADGIPGSYYQPIGYRGVGSFNIGVTGTAKTGAFELGRENGAVGSSTVAGLWELTGNSNTSIGKNDGSIGHLVIEATGTITVTSTAAGNYFALGLNANSTGTAIIRGYLNTGTRSNGTNDGNLIIGHSGTGYMLIEQSGTVFASGTGSNNASLTMGKNAGSHGTLDVAGHLDLGAGFARIGIAGDADVNILGTGNMKIGHHLQIGQGATGTINVDGHLSVGTDLYVGNSSAGVLDLRSGGTVIVGGTTIIGSSAAATGTLHLNGGVLETRQIALGAGSSTVVLNGGTIRAAASTDNFFANFADLDFDAGTLAFDTQAFSVTATNALAGTAAATLDKLGSGSLVLTADSSAYAGTINVRAGGLVGGTGAKIGGTVNILAGGALDLRTGPLTVNDINFADNSIIRYSLTGEHILTADSIDFLGAGTFYLDRDGKPITDIAINPGTYTIATFNTLSGQSNLENLWQISASDFSFTGTMLIDTTNPGTIKIRILTADVDSLTWIGNSGDWDNLTNNWLRLGNPTPVLWNDGAFATFDTGTGAINVDGLRTVYGLQFDTDTDYTFIGTGTLAALGAMEIETYTASANAAISTALQAPTLNKTGLGTLTLGGSATITGASTIYNGTLNIAPAGTLSTAGLSIAPAANNTATVNIAGFLTNSGDLNIGNEGSGALIVSGTVNQAADTFVALTGNASGLLRIETGARFNQTAGTLRIGGGAAGDAATSGTLIIGTGGTATTSAGLQIGAYGSGSAQIDGYLRSGGATYIGVFDGAQGVATIGADGTLEAATFISIGYQAGASGTLNVAGLAKATTNLVLGQYDNAIGSVLNISETGTVTTGGYVYIGSAASTTGTVNVAGLLAATTNLVVANGENSTGYLDITGTATAGGFGSIGHALGSTGVASVSGELTVTSTMFVGNLGNGNLTLGGTARFNTVSYLGNGAAAQGALTIENGGYLSTGGRIYVSNNGGAGTLNIEDGGYLRAGTGIMVGYNGYGEFNLAAGGTLILDGQSLYIGGDASGSTTAHGIVIINGYVETAASTYYIPVGYSGTGVLRLGQTGTIFAGQLDIGREATASGTVIIDGFYKSSAGSTAIGNNGNGTLVIEQTGTFISGVEAANTYVAIGLNANSQGTAIVRGFLDSGPRGSSTDGALIIGHSATGVMTIESTGTVIASGTGGDSLALTMGKNAAGNGTLNLAGLLSLNNGGAAIGTTGVATINIASTGTMLLDGQYRQNQISTLAINFDPARTDPYITAGSALLSGTLAIDSIGYTPITKASEINEIGILVLTATAGGISGNFTAFTGIDGSGLPDYITVGGQTQTNGDGTASYYAGYRLSWNSLANAHGYFTINAGETFEVDTSIANRYGEGLSEGWDGKSLTKLGEGTLILSGENTFTGTVNVAAGTLRFGGPAIHGYGPLVNNGVVDFGNTATADFRTVNVTGLSGNGTFHMNVNPGTGESDRLNIAGSATGNHQLILAASANAAALGADSPSPILATISGSNTAVFTGGLDYNGANYVVARSSVGNIVLATNGAAGVGDPIRGVPGSQSIMWFASQDNLSRRLGELRTQGNVPAGDYSVWLRARAEHASLGSGTDMRPFDMDLFGFELGADKTFALLPAARIVIGLYAGYGHASQDFDPRAGTGTADGTSDQIALGLYAAWLHSAGWFANVTVAGSRYDNDFTSADQSGNRSHGDYNDDALGASLEFGKRITLDRAIGAGWFAEPSAQVSLVRLMRGDYRTTGANRLDVDGSSAVTTRLRATLRAGRVWRQMEIAARAGASHETSSGGEISIGADRWSPNVDGTRAEAGVGLIWRRTPAGQFYFDYEFATGDSYQKPWSFSLGYRHAF